MQAEDALRSRYNLTKTGNTERNRKRLEVHAAKKEQARQPGVIHVTVRLFPLHHLKWPLVYMKPGDFPPFDP